MGARFYRASPIFLLGLAWAGTGCSDPAGQAPAAIEPAPAFPQARRQSPYSPPPDGDLVPRYLGHLERASREGLRFALARLGELGSEAAPAIGEAIREKLRSPMDFAVLHNLCDALGRTGDAASATLLLEVLQTSPVPVVRSAAADALAALGNPQAVPGIIEAIERESEAGPALRLYGALGVLGGARAGEYLEAQAQRWLAEDPALVRTGPAAWSALLVLDDARAGERLARLGQRMAPAFRVPSLVRRVQLGESGLGAELRTFLDAQRFLSAGVRSEAVRGLALSGDWEGVLLALADPSPKVVAAGIQALRMPAAAEADLGAAQLQELAASEDDQIALPALQALVERGDRRGLEPWIRVVREYPTAPRSADALHILGFQGMADARVPPLLIKRWQFCSLDQRLDLLRVLGRIGDPASLSFFGELLSDPQTHGDARIMALTQLGNFGEAAIPVLLEHLERPLRDYEVAPALAALGRLAGDERAAGYFRRVAVDPGAPDLVRRDALELLPKILGGEAYAVLLAARDASQRGEVTSFLDGILSRYF